jgi:hypothetical protein
MFINGIYHVTELLLKNPSTLSKLKTRIGIKIFHPRYIVPLLRFTLEFFLFGSGFCFLKSWNPDPPRIYADLIKTQFAIRRIKPYF